MQDSLGLVQLAAWGFSNRSGQQNTHRYTHRGGFWFVLYSLHFYLPNQKRSTAFLFAANSRCWPVQCADHHMFSCGKHGAERPSALASPVRRGGVLRSEVHAVFSRSQRTLLRSPDQPAREALRCQGRDPSLASHPLTLPAVLTGAPSRARGNKHKVLIPDSPFPSQTSLYLKTLFLSWPVHYHMYF